MSFFIYDLGFLVIFSLFVVWFLYSNKKNVKREGILYLYKTQRGIKAINWFSDKFRKPLHYLQYLIILSGYLLMAGIVYLLGSSIWTYLRHSKEIVKIVRAPPIAPLIPYFPRLFGMESMLPPLYFTYFLVSLIVVMFVHEFSHGIYMRLHKIKIKSTGFAALGPLLGAFVEQDEKDMESKGRIEQLSVLAAGTFANLIFGLLFLCIFIGFFYLAFVPSGYIFNAYAMTAVPVSLVTGLEDYSDNLSIFKIENQSFFLDETLAKQLGRNVSEIIVYSDAPAIKAGLRGVIVDVGGFEVRDQASLSIALDELNPGEVVIIQTLDEEGIKEFQLLLGENPKDNSKAYLGIASIPKDQSIASFMSPKKYSTYYTTRWNEDFVVFVFDLIFWIMFINLMVALFNMLPLGILDGGRFFYLTVEGISKSSIIAKKLFKFITYLILFGFLLVMLVWVTAVF